MKPTLIALVLTAAVTAQPDAPPAAPPNPADQAKARQLMHEVFKAEYARRGPQAQRELAAKLRQESLTSANPATRYVLLTESSRLAAEVGDWETALAALDDLGARFKVDTPAMKLEAIRQLRRSTRTREDAELGARYTNAFIDQAMKQGKFDLAADALPLLTSLATAAKNAPLTVRARKLRGEIRARALAQHTYWEAVQKLEADPKDAHAMHVVGRYVALYEGDWARGLPLIAEGSDIAWAAAAKADLANPVNPEDMEKVAETWWDLGVKQSAAKRYVWVRARFWYGLLAQNTEGLAQRKAQMRVEQINQTVADGRSGGAPAGPALSSVINTAITEETRKALPTPEDLRKLKSLYLSYRSGKKSSYDEYQKLKDQLFRAVSDNLHKQPTADYLARCKAQMQIYDVMLAAGDKNGVPDYRPPGLLRAMHSFLSMSKSHTELAARILAIQVFIQREKPVFQKNTNSGNSSEKGVYNGIKGFVARNQPQYESKQSRLKLHDYLKQRGVTNGGLKAFRADIERMK